jgi:hypothetical protein
MKAGGPVFTSVAGVTTFLAAGAIPNPSGVKTSFEFPWVRTKRNGRKRSKLIFVHYIEPKKTSEDDIERQ